MHDNFMDILNVLRNDEDLLRLLYYPPKDLVKGIKDPLDSSLPNILDMDKMKLKNIRDEHIMKSAKTDDLEDKEICRLYVYMGRRRPDTVSYAVAKQQVIVDVLCHNDIENSDLRSNRIADRLSYLFAWEHITGLGKMDYVDGNNINSPKEYIGYRHIYIFGGNKK